MELRSLFPYSFAFLQILWILAIAAALYKGYGYFKRYRIARKLNSVAASDSIFNYPLPPEIIEEIFSYLDPASLLAAAQVNRSWQRYSCLDSLRVPLFERESAKQMSLSEIEKELDLVFNNHLPVNKVPNSSPRQPKLWPIEDNMLSKRLNKKIIDVTLLSAEHIAMMRPANLDKYLLKTRLKPIAEGDEFIDFVGVDTPPNLAFKRISKNLLANWENIGEEYEIIVDFDKIVRINTLRDTEIHRFRVTKVLNPIKGLLMILTLIYPPILLNDIATILRAENSENFSHYIARLAGVAMMLYLDGIFFFDIFTAVAAIKQRARVFGSLRNIYCGIFFILLFYVEFARRNFIVWCNIGICWIIGIALYAYIKFCMAVWSKRRYQIGLKLLSSAIIETIILFICAVDWSLLFEAIATGRIWRTLMINMAYSLSIMLTINFEKIVIQSLYAFKFMWSSLDAPLAEWIRGISAQIFIVVLFSAYAPAGFDH